MTEVERAAYAAWLQGARPLLEAGQFGEALKDVPRLELAPAVPRPLAVPLARARVALVTSAGLSAPGQPKMDGPNIEGDYTVRLLEADLDPSTITITHTHFDHTAAEQDINVIYPIDRLKELAAAGEVGSVTSPAVSFMGYFSNVFRMRDEVAPSVVSAVAASGADAVLLVPV
ncbi:MAG: hypothetical protein KGJ86_01970 [Chloroflexota bacterium]|nr:hypothetical protein [Chloroflexota bacterium]